MSKETKKKSTRTPTEVTKFVNNVLGKMRHKVNYYDNPFGFFEDIIYDMNPDDVINVSKKATEKSVVNAIKRSKQYKAILEGIVEEAAQDMMSNIYDAKRELEEEKKRQAINAAEDAKRQAIIDFANKKIADERKKTAAKKSIFLEGLTATQKKDLKMLFKVQ